MQNLYRAGRRDDNENPFKKYLNDCGIPYIVLQPGQGADLQIFVDTLVFVEVKNPDAPKARQELTDTEKQVKAWCDERGILYVVVFRVEELQAFVDLRFSKYAVSYELLQRVTVR